MSTATSITTTLVALVFLAAASMKLTGQEKSLATRDELGIDAVQWRGLGVLEIAGAVGAMIGLAVRPLGIAAMLGLLLMSLGALGAHVRMANLRTEGAAAVIALLLSTAALVLQVATA